MRTKGEMSAGRSSSGAQRLNARPGEFVSVDGTDGSHGKQMEFVLHIVRQHSGLLGRKWPSSIFRTMVYTLSGVKAYAPRVNSSLALLEPFQVQQQWGMNDQKRLRRLVDKKDAAWVKKAESTRSCLTTRLCMKRLVQSLGRSPSAKRDVLC